MWKFLEIVDKNLLYNYAQVIDGSMKQLQDSKSHRGGLSESEELMIAQQRRDNAYYLIWFVYRYVLQCKTLEDTIPYANEETLKKYRLNSYIINNYLYVGIDKDICFRKSEDINIILEILYNRYGFFEQMECFIRHTSNIRRKRCIQAMEKYKEILSNMEKG